MRPKKLKEIWSKRQLPRLAKELEYRVHTLALLKKQIAKETRTINALRSEVSKRIIK